MMNLGSSNYKNYQAKAYFKFPYEFQTTFLSFFNKSGNGYGTGPPVPSWDSQLGIRKRPGILSRQVFRESFPDVRDWDRDTKFGSEQKIGGTGTANLTAGHEILC